MSATGFDVRAYMRDPHLIRPDHLDPVAMGSLSGSTLQALAYLWAVEGSMLGRLRDVLVTPAHADSRVTAFLTTWTYEQHWLTATLASLLEANGRTPEAPIDTALGRVRRSWDERARPTVDAVSSNILGTEITGAHMVTGWLDTAVLALVYRQLGEVEPGLTHLSNAVIRMKDRHLDFHIQEAGSRLAGSAATRRVARTATRRWRLPGTRYAGPAQVRAVAAHLCAATDARIAVANVDLALADLPGLAGLHPVRTALQRLGPRRVPPTAQVPPETPRNAPDCCLPALAACCSGRRHRLRPVETTDRSAG